MCEAKNPTLTFPVKRQLWKCPQSFCDELGRLVPVKNGRRDIRRQPGKRQDVTDRTTAQALASFDGTDAWGASILKLARPSARVRDQRNQIQVRLRRILWHNDNRFWSALLAFFEPHLEGSEDGASLSIVIHQCMKVQVNL